MRKSGRLPLFIIIALFLLAVMGISDSWAAVPRVEAGGNHSLALKADGSIWAWGDNTFGQVGDGSTTARNAPVRVGADSNWSAVSAGFYHTLALKSDGTLWAWGDNTKGQLGDGSVSFSQAVPVRIGTDTNWAAVAAGDFHSLALKTDGSLWAWGDNTSGQVGNGSVAPANQPVPVRIGTAIGWVAIAAGASHSMALKTDHTLWAWGSNAAGQLGNGTNVDAVAPVQIVLPAPFINNDWSAVAAGRFHTAALKTDSSLWAWGSNTFGQLGNGTNLDSDVPVREAGGATNWLAVAAGDAHTVGRQATGAIWTWGGNQSGQLGNGTNADANVPVKVGADTDWSDASAGSAHTAAMKTNGTIWGWGDNAFGQLGDGTNISRNSPVQALLSLPPATGVTITPDQPTPHTAGTAVNFAAAGTGSSGYQYRFWLYDVTTASWTVVQDYDGAGPVWTMPASQPVGDYVIAVDVRTGTSVSRDAVAYLSYQVTLPPAAAVTITPSFPGPHAAPVIFTADAGSPAYQYRFWLYNGTAWSNVQEYGFGPTWTMPASTPVGSYMVAVDARGSMAVGRDTVAYQSYQVITAPATGVTITPSQNPHTTGDVIFTAAGQGAAGYDYRFWLYSVSTSTWTMVQDYGGGATWTMPAATTTAGSYVIAVDVRTSGVVNRDTVAYLAYQF